MKKSIAVAVLLGLLITVTLHAPTRAASVPFQPITLDSFETKADLAIITEKSASFSQSTQGVTNGTYSLRANFIPATYPTIYITPASPWNLSSGSGIGIDVTNPTSSPISVHFGASDSGKHDQLWMLTIQPGLNRMLLQCAPSDPLASTMDGVPAPQGVRLVSPADTAIDYSHITGFWAYLASPSVPATLYFDNLSMYPTMSLSGICDAFGQYTGYSWTGKVASLADIAANASAEAAAAAASLGPVDRDQYGGWADGPQLKATGWFYTAQQGGKWWLVDPVGHLFFSVGIDAINSACDTSTLIAGRNRMFTGLPQSGDPLAAFYNGAPSTQSYTFYTANLYRKYGSSYAAKYVSFALGRLTNWGFNTVGNASDVALLGNHLAASSVRINLAGKYNTVTLYNSSLSMPDPFDPTFAPAVTSSAQPQTAAEKNDPWLIGYYVDNELSWTTLASDGNEALSLGVLAQGNASPAKNAFVKSLTSEYVTIAKLNSAWNSKFASWSSMLSTSYAVPSVLSTAETADLDNFVTAYANQYYSIVSKNLKALDPNHLYLGSKFCHLTQPVVQACAKYSDVVSFDLYGTTVDPSTWGWLASIGKPCLVGEFHFGATDRGMFSPGLVDAGSQANRGVMYEAYVKSVLDNPAFVGCHYFRYVDEPLTGRSDGENYGMGFVSVADNPYPEIVAAARAINDQIYAVRGVAL